MSSYWIIETSQSSPTLLAWSSYSENNISIIELENESYANFVGAQIKNGPFELQSYIQSFSVYRLLDACERDFQYKITRLSQSS